MSRGKMRDLEKKITIESLPPEILETIIKCLPPFDVLCAERVCRRWREASRRAWKNINELYIWKKSTSLFRNVKSRRDHVVFQDNRLYIADNKLEIINFLLSRVGEYIKRFCYKSSPVRNNGAVISVITKYCLNIEFMELVTLNNLNVEKIQKLIRVNKKLHSMKCIEVDDITEILPGKDWKRLRFENEDCDPLEERVISLIQNSESLEDFGTDHWTPNIVSAIAKCRQLKTLSSVGCVCASSIIDSELISHIPMLNALTSLDIHVQTPYETLFADVLEECYNLKFLRSRHDGDLPATTKDIVLGLRQLETVEIGCREMPDGFFMPFAKFKNFSFLDKKMLPDEDILRIIEQSKHLESLGLASPYFEEQLLNDLLRVVRECRKTLKLNVSPNLYEKIFKKFEGSKIQIVHIDWFRMGSP